MDETPRWTTFALASDDLTGAVLGRIEGGEPLAPGDPVGLRSPSGVKRFRVAHVYILEQVWPDAWTNRLVTLEPM